MSIMLPRASVAAKRINEVMNTEVSILDGEAHALPDKGAKGEVRFEHVGFSYPGADEETLTDIDFSAHKGETVAFIGSTGSGKSTLVNLIPRFFDVSSGRILVDGVDVRDMKLTDLRDRIGYVPQKGVLFSGTIDSNIRYGKEDATDAEVQRAAEVAQAWDFIQEKEEKVDSEIAQGRHQRIRWAETASLHCQSHLQNVRRSIFLMTVFLLLTIRQMWCSAVH